MKWIKRLANLIFPIVSLCLLVATWAIVAKAVDIELIIPSVKTTFVKLGELLTSNNFFIIVGGTLTRTLQSFGIAFILALALAFVSAFIPIIYRFFAPIITIIRAIPTMSVILLTIIWLKPGESPLLVAFLIIFPIMYSGFFTAFSNVDKNLSQMCDAYKVTKINKFLKFYLPSIAPGFFDNIKSCLSLTVKLIISAEVLAQTKNSMGVMMQISKAYLESAELLAWTIIAIILSYLLETCVLLIKKAVVRWER